MELYKKYRPKSLKRIVGQPEAVKILQNLIDANRIPHAILLSGPSGCGKTSMARILKRELGCSDQDFSELNCADFRGIDMVRDIRACMGLSPLVGDCRVWLIDEAHQLTGPAQDAFLKILEDTPSWVYFLLATTDPQKLKPTIRTRCTEIKVKLLGSKDMEDLLRQISRHEKLDVPEEVVDQIIESAEGSPRKALVLLDSISGLEHEEMLFTIASADTQSKGIELARALLKPSLKWPSIAKILKNLDDDPEAIRWIVLGYANTVLASGNGRSLERSYAMIEAFRENFYDSKKAGLTAACYEVVSGG